MEPEEDDPARCRKPGTPSQFAEILIEGEENSVLADRAGQDVGIRAARRIGADLSDIVPRASQCHHGAAREIFVGEEAHRLSGSLERVDTFGP